MSIQSKAWIAVFFCGWMSLTPSVFAKSKMDFLEGSKKLVSIDLRDSDVVDVLRFLAQKGGFNIFVNPGISGRVTLYLQNVRIATILDIILLSNNLAYQERDSVVYIVTQEEYRTRFGEDYGDARDVKLVRLKYAPPAQVFSILDPLKSKVGSIVVDAQNGTIILMDTPEKMKFMLEVIKEMDQAIETKVFDLDYAKAADIVPALTARLDSKSVGAIQSDARSNQIIVTALPNKMKEIETLINQLDRQTRQVVIDTQIVKIDLKNNHQAGINWELFFQGGAFETLDFKSALTNSNTPLTSTFGQIQYGTLAHNGYTATLQRLNTLGDTRILASPSLTVIEGEEAKILIGSREASISSTTTVGTSGSGNTVSDTVSYIDVGTSLTISALINKKGFVTLKIKPEVSNVRETLTSATLDSGTSSNTRIPIVDTTQAETRVMVKDGTTIIMGGLRKDQKTDTSNQVPFFGEIPVVGGLFKNRDSALTQSELVVFITPHIIQGDKNMSDGPIGLTMKDIQPYVPGAAEVAVKAIDASTTPLKMKDVVTSAKVKNV